jgi:acyl-CoA thioester hydrolase
MFGHLNNAVYYQLFDTAINGWINTNVEVDPVTMPLQGIVAESGCRYFSELRFPEKLVVGLAVTRLGRTSATYRLGMFRAAEQLDGVGVGSPPASGGGDTPLRSGDPSYSWGTIAALGHWVHVYIDRTSRKPAPIPDVIRALLSTACIG